MLNERKGGKTFPNQLSTTGKLNKDAIAANPKDVANNKCDSISGLFPLKFQRRRRKKVKKRKKLLGLKA